MVKRYLVNIQDGLVPTTILSREFAGDSSMGNKNLASTLELGSLFTYPKPVKLLIKLMQIGINTNAIILDFFSGSATTAHAVMQLNAEDGGNRKFIMVQVPEETPKKSESRKVGYANICEIGKERIRRAGAKIKEEIEQVNANVTPSLLADTSQKKVPEIGFRVLKVDSINMEKSTTSPTNIISKCSHSLKPISNAIENLKTCFSRSC